MKTLKFTDDLVSLVISGAKKSTWRVFEDKDLRAGDELTLINKATGKEFAIAEIEYIKEKSLDEIQDSDFVDHEKFETPGKMLDSFRFYYGDNVTMDTIVKMVNFKLLKILE